MAPRTKLRCWFQREVALVEWKLRACYSLQEQTELRP